MFSPSSQPSQPPQSKCRSSIQTPTSSNRRSARLTNRSNNNMGTQPHTEANTQTQGNQHFSSSLALAQYQQYVSSVLNNSPMLFPMASNQVAAPGHNPHHSLQGSLQHTEKLASTGEELEKTKRDNAILRRELEAYKKLYEALKFGGDGEPEASTISVQKRSPTK